MSGNIKYMLIPLLIITLMFSGGCKSKKQDPVKSGPEQQITSEGKYTPNISLVSVKSVDATVIFSEGEDIYNNVWTRAYKEKLGIDLSYMWVVDASQYQQKLTATVMSGDIPDVFVCNPMLFKMLYDSGLTEDLSEIYGTYASGNTKTILEQDRFAIPCGTIEGKIMGIPLTDASIAGAPILWLRQDWMGNLNMGAPKSMEDVLLISKKFTDGDPNKSGMDDTTGLAVSKELWSAFGGLQGFFNGFHAYPRIWFEKDGTLVYGTIQPEMKQALSALQNMYKNGEIDREFGVKDSNKVAEAIATGKCGMEFGVWWNPYSPLNLSQANFPDAYWQAYPIPSVDDSPAKSQYSAAVGALIVVRKGYANPEAPFKMLNFWSDNFLSSSDKELRDTYLGSLEEPEIVKYKYTDFHIWEPNAMLRVYENVKKALAGRSLQGLNYDESQRYQVISAYFDQGIKEAWVEVATYGVNGSVSILDKISKESGLINEFYGAPTPVMSLKMAALHSLEDEMITKIIMGESVESFDSFVREWHNMGGEEIVKEVNEWKAAQSAGK